MTSLPFASELCDSVSYDALEASLVAASLAAAICVATPVYVSWIARIQIWLRLIWGQGWTESQAVPVARALPLNRARARLERRRLPLARQGDDLSRIIYRVLGRAKYLSWIYDYKLTGRVRWCFSDWNWKWAKRITFKGDARAWAAKHAKPYCVLCGALSKLHPD